MGVGFKRGMIAAGMLAGMLASHAASTAAAGRDGVDPASRSAVDAGNLGLYSANDFRLVRGECPDCATIRQALWYFQNDIVAVPKSGARLSAYSRGISAQEDVRRWYSGTTGEDRLALPPLVWIGSPEMVFDARLRPEEEKLVLRDGSAVRFKLTPKIPENRSFYDAQSAEFFRRRPLRIRGHFERSPGATPAFVARTIWPQDYTIDAARLELSPLRERETLESLVRREAKGEPEGYETRLLWERNPVQPRKWDNLAVLGILLNGAQGDDDEAHGGHFAIVTGRLGPGGTWADWMVNNFYNLDSFSEKGIVAAMVPMDNYQMDLNSGQSYYRPSYMLVALLKDDHAAEAYQGAIQRVYNRFYRHDFLYHHAAANCAGISMDTLRSIGWNIPARGATSYVKAVMAYPYIAVKEMSLASGKKSFEYLKEEQTRLYPAVAFDAAGNDLLRLVAGTAGPERGAGALDQRLRRDVEAVIFVRIPQLPSSRALGTYPVASIDEYLKRVPEDKSQWQIVPVEPRPFPNQFADAEALSGAADQASAVVAVVIAVIGGACFVFALRRRRARAR